MDKCIIFLPGFMRTPDYYAKLVEALSECGLVFCYCPPGILHRRDVDFEPGVAPLIDDAAEQFGGWHSKTEGIQDSPSLIIGHSWGSHIARGLVLHHFPKAKLVEIDPRLRQVVQDPASIDNYPTYFASRWELVAAYAAYGVVENDVPWSHWDEQDGEFRLAFNLVTLRAQLLDHYDEPHETWRRIAENRGELPTIWRTGTFSLNDESLWTEASQSGLVRVQLLEGVGHDLRAITQADVASQVMAECSLS